MRLRSNPKTNRRRVWGDGMTRADNHARNEAPLFDGFTRGRPRAGPWSGTVVDATAWLLTNGWRRHGATDPREVPGHA